MFKSFDFERTWWRLFQKRVVRTKFDIYDFIKFGNQHFLISHKGLYLYSAFIGYKYGSILWLEDDNSYLRLRKCRTQFILPMEKSVTFTGACANEIIPLISRSFVYKAKEGRHVRIACTSLHQVCNPSFTTNDFNRK